MKLASSYGCLPEAAFRDQRWAGYLPYSRFPARPGWQTDQARVWEVLTRDLG